MNALAASEGATAAELAHLLGASRSDVVVELVELESLGVAVCRGTGVGTRWRLG